MQKGRVEAFSDGVIAILITIMVLEMKAPHGHDIRDLLPVIPVFSSYILSFIYLGIYWSNHHHLFQAVEQVKGGVLLANLHLLFWLSLIPFATAWMGENDFMPWPVALYGLVLLMSGAAYFILTGVLLRHHAEGSALAIAIGKDWKGKISMGIYVIAIPLSFVNQWIAFGLYVLTALMWILPDRRIERVVGG